MKQPKNQVLTDDARRSCNFFKSDKILRHYLDKYLSDDALDYMNEKLQSIGKHSATVMNELSLKADKNPPELKKRTKYGEDINEVEFHPAYWRLMDIAARSEMFYVQYDPKLRERFEGLRHTLGFAAGQLYAMSELGAYCPLCMTDGTAYLVDEYAPGEIRERLLPKLSAKKGDQLYTGAMFLTEKAGGSDVGRNVSTAEQVERRKYKLNGEKWFCSNVNADVVMALARTGDVEDGTGGLSLFLLEKTKPNGDPNPMIIKRLKDKLGVRSMATGEVIFDDTIGTRLGEDNKGFKLMAEMINISRTYNAVGAVACSRRAIIEAYQYLSHRIIFGKRAIEHALVRQKFHQLGALYLGNFLLAWRAIRAMDAAETGDDDARKLMRLLVPMAKWQTAEQGVYIVRECMELMGGNGYIEDFVMPKLLRDVNVLPIWEGSGNVIVLDILRAAKKSGGLQIIIRQIRQAAKDSKQYGSLMIKKLDALVKVREQLQQTDDRDTIESTAKALFKQLIHLYQMALMIDERDEKSRAWIEPALAKAAEEFETSLKKTTAIRNKKIDALIGWEY